MRVCLVGATHVCHNPRLLREADLLAELGHQVRVVTPSFMPELAERDRQHLARRKWRLATVNYVPQGWRGQAQAFYVRGRHRLTRAIYQRVPFASLAEATYTATAPELAHLAAREPAAWFIAHTQNALPAAAAAAQRHTAQLGFDCEDLLAEHAPATAGLTHAIEQRYLPRCQYVSIPSQAMAEKLRAAHRLEKQPTVLYNVFPLALADGLLPPALRPTDDILRVHWFSQTIGPQRGLEEAMTALGLVGAGVELHLRGNWAGGYERVLQQLAQQHRVKIIIYPQIQHDELIKAMSGMHVGLASERNTQINAALTVSNKIGSYALAGLAIAATDTPGQSEIMARMPAAGFLYPEGQPALLAAALRRWRDDRQALRKAQEAAWQAARDWFCWEHESRKFLHLLGLSTQSK